MKLLNNEEYNDILKKSIYIYDLMYPGMYKEYYVYARDIYDGDKEKAYTGICSDGDERLEKLKLCKDGLIKGIEHEWDEAGNLKLLRLNYHLMQSVPFKYVYSSIFGYWCEWNSKKEIIIKDMYFNSMCFFEKTEPNKKNSKIKFNLEIFKQLQDFAQANLKKIKEMELSSLVEERFVDNKFVIRMLEIAIKYINVNLEAQQELVAAEFEKLLDERIEREKAKICLNPTEVMQKNGKIFYDDNLFNGIVTDFKWIEAAEARLLTKYTEYKNGLKDGIEIVWQPIAEIHPDFPEKYGMPNGGCDDDWLEWDEIEFEIRPEFWSYSKSTIKELNIYKEGKLIEQQLWNIKSLKFDKDEIISE